MDPKGAIFQLRAIPVGDPTLSALEVSTSCVRTCHFPISLCDTELWRKDLFLYLLIIWLLREPLWCLHFISSLPSLLPIDALSIPFYRTIFINYLAGSRHSFSSNLPLLPPLPLPLPLLQIWGAEYQENNAFLVAPENLAVVKAMGERENCPVSAVGLVTDGDTVRTYLLYYYLLCVTVRLMLSFLNVVVKLSRCLISRKSHIFFHLSNSNVSFVSHLTRLIL